MFSTIICTDKRKNGAGRGNAHLESQHENDASLGYTLCLGPAGITKQDPVSRVRVKRKQEKEFENDAPADTISTITHKNRSNTPSAVVLNLWHECHS